VLHGDHGYSQKGATPGNASEYYSLTRMPTEGTVTIEGEPFRVRGASWMDHEFGTTFLEKYQQGWDWFALQLADGRELMFYLLRRRDGTVASFSAGTLVAADGATRALAASDVRVDTLAHWTSSRSGVRYPSRWRLSVPSAALQVQIEPRLADQELIVGTRYWEGAVAVSGSADGRPIAGQGYVELVGYAE
jgi:predicted secreted hydrolase